MCRCADVRMCKLKKCKSENSVSLTSAHLHICTLVVLQQLILCYKVVPKRKYYHTRGILYIHFLEDLGAVTLNRAFA